MNSFFSARHVLGIICVSLALLPVAAVTPAIAGQPDSVVQISVHENQPEQITLHYELGDFESSTVQIEGLDYTQITLGSESPTMEVGAPQLPTVNRSIVIPNDAAMAVRVVASESYELRDIDIVPSKGSILRTVDPEDVPYTFTKVYQTNADYPGDLVSLRNPYILRDLRGVVVELYPFQYNPVRRTLRVYTEMTVEVVATGQGQINVLAPRAFPAPEAFRQVYRNRFLNYQPLRQAMLNDETGSMLIIAHDPWIPNVQPLVAHKIARGLNTTLVGMSTIPGGNNAVAIKNYIQSVYDTTNLSWVLLVGDGAQIACPFSSGGAADPTYALLAGSDSYPDIFVGRFSAETAAHVDTQVWRTIDYEQMPASSQDWFWKGTGIASNQGPGDDGEYDNQHMNVIRQKLLDYGYTQVDQFYDPSATAGQVSAAVNEGRGIINYTGHGSTTSWSTTGFSNYNVNSLVNDNMLPFITSVACVNGQFDGPTCFAEAWLRATHNGEPSGAIAMYASSVNQYWNEPMCGQDMFIDLLTTDSYVSFGAMCFMGSCQMMDEYGGSGVDMFETWHIFGDPSVHVIQAEILGDLNGDGVVNAEDLALLLGGWGPCLGCPEDLNRSGGVGAQDLALLLGNWG